MTGLRILVLGATGFIGPAVMRRIIARGHHPIAASRMVRASKEAGEVVRVDRREPEDVAACMQSVRPDVVIDLIAYTQEETVPVLAQLPGRVERYVLASSGDVYRQYDLLHRRDTGVPTLELREDSPLRARPFPYRSEEPRQPGSDDAWMDDYDKIPIEHAVQRATGFSWSILRLPMVFGPGDRNRRFAWAVHRMRRGDAELALDEEWAGWRTSLGYVDDVADALVLAAIHPAAHGHIFNVGPLHVKTNQDWALALKTACDWGGEIQLIKRSQAPEVTQVQLGALDLTVPMRLNTSAIREAIGYAEMISEEDALASTVAFDS